MPARKLALSDVQIRAFCLKHHIRSLALFGSVLSCSMHKDDAIRLRDVLDAKREAMGYDSYAGATYEDLRFGTPS